MKVAFPKKTGELAPTAVMSLDYSAISKSPYVLDWGFQGIANQMKWFQTVIEDSDWDFSSIIDALKYKIQNTCRYIEKTQRHLDWERDVKWMRLCIKLMDKLWPDEYSDVTTYESEYNEYH